MGFAAARFFLLAVFLSSFHDLSRFSLLLGIACSRLGWSGISFSAPKQRASGQRDDIHDRSVFEAPFTFEKANELFKSQHSKRFELHWQKPCCGQKTHILKYGSTRDV